MRKWALLVLIVALFGFPTLARAQGGVAFNDFNVQLLPEYDRASMLVIYDFSLANTANTPANFAIKIPAEAELFAVAYNQNGNLINATFSGPEVQGDWQVITMVTNGESAFRIEYYEPISFNNTQRQYTYLWPGDYAVNAFNVFLGEPLDVDQITTEPAMSEMQREADGLPGLGKNFGSLGQGEQFTLLVQYVKTSDALVAPSDQNQLQPSAPVDENTPGRVSLTNYLPWIFGGFGLVLILGGLLYYWQSGTRRGGGSGSARRRKRAQAVEQEDGEAQYCHQCGTRAKPNDRFCRVCGSRLRQES